MTDEQATSGLIAAVAAHGVPGSSVGQVCEVPLLPEVWAPLLGRVRSERLQGALAAAVASGALPTTTEQTAAAHDEHAAAMASALRLDHQLLEVASVLGDASIDLRVLKGAAVAHLDHPDPAQRCYADVDILVRSDQVADAITVLAGHGRGRDLPERRAGFDARFSKEATTFLEDGTEVDIHRTLALGPYGMRIVLTDLWGPGQELHLAGRTLTALDRECRLLHACYNAQLGDPNPRLVALRDIALMGNHPDLDVDRALRLAAAWRGEAVVVAAVSAATTRLGVDLGPLGAWAADRRPSAVDRRLLRAYRSGGGTNSLELLSGVIGARGVQDRMAYLWAIVFPDRAYREARRAGGRSNEWRHGARELLRATRR